MERNRIKPCLWAFQQHEPRHLFMFEFSISSKLKGLTDSMAYAICVYRLKRRVPSRILVNRTFVFYKPRFLKANKF